MNDQYGGGDPSATAIFGSRDSEPAPVQVSLSPDNQAAVNALPPGSALLIVQRGPVSGARFLLDADTTVAGRSPSADIFLDDVTVSRKHASFVRTDNGFMMRDAGSLNGTYVNRERVDECLLQAGDEVQIGKFRMTYHPCPNGER